MIHVWRICKVCGRKFGIKHEPGDNLPATCTREECQREQSTPTANAGH